MLYTQVIFAISALKYHDTGSSANCIRAYPRTRFGVEKKLYSNSIIFLYRLLDSYVLPYSLCKTTNLTT